MNQNLFTTLLSWEVAMVLAKCLVYVTPVFLLFDMLYINMAKKRNLSLKSKYFNYHLKGHFFSTPGFKIVFWCLIFLYVQYTLVHKPFIVVIALVFYFITIIGLVVQVHRKISKNDINH